MEIRVDTEGSGLAQTSEVPMDSAEQSLSPIQQQVINMTSKQVTMTLLNGRKLVLQKPKGAVSWKLAKLLGANSTNGMLEIYGKFLMCIVMLDGSPVSPPLSGLELDALAERLGDDFEECISRFMYPEAEGQPTIADQVFGAVEDAKK